MLAQNKKKLNLLEMPNPERVNFFKEVREKLQQRILEAKLWQSLLEVENLVVNGNIVYRGDEQLSGFFLKNEV